MSTAVLLAPFMRGDQVGASCRDDSTGVGGLARCGNPKLVSIAAMGAANDIDCRRLLTVKVRHSFGFFFLRVRNLLIENASHVHHSDCIIERTP
ncbi:hypothetical protein [Xanthomonas sp. 10-10]|uniref:Uncharacterized protein n=1 Tax=Xanthomonas sp. 10-10 TaxID=3115848 RepID=A0AAU7P5I3_9XANT